MKIITFNANGIRSAARKGFFEWLANEQSDADIVCIQETKAQIDQLSDNIFHPEDYYCYYFDAQKKGYSGVAVYSRVKPQHIQYGLGFDLANHEGRYLQLDFEAISVASLYMPSGSSGDVRQQAKFDFLDSFYPYLAEKVQDTQRDMVVCADWNMCHQEIDLKNWKANQKNSGFLPEERAWLTRVYDELNWKDSFRLINQYRDQYTWWSNRGQAWQKNVGWRLDYQVITPGLHNKVLQQEIYTAQRFSDHAPLIMTYEVKLSG